MSGVQLPIGIETVNAVDANYKIGPWASIAAAKAGIDIALRFNNMYFYVTGDPLIYYWLDSDLSDAGLLSRTPTGGSGISLPIVRSVYLLADSTDVTRYGGASNNVYNTFQSAYDAANTLQIALGGNNIVSIQVGNTISNMVGAVISSLVGNLVLTANFNPRVHIIGMGANTSVLGNITASNASGSSFTLGTASTTPMLLQNVSVGSITTSATGATGNGGQIYLRVISCNIGAMTSSITNAANTTGIGGNINIDGGFQSVRTASQFSSISTRAQSATGTAGNLNITLSNSIFGLITTSVTNLGGLINCTGISNTFAGVSVNTTTTNPGTINFTRCTFTSNTSIIVPPGATPGLPVINLIDCNFLTTSTIRNFNTSGTQLEVNLLRCQFTSTLTSNFFTKKYITGCSWAFSSAFSCISNLGNNSILSNCDFSNTNTTVALINNIGTSVFLYSSNFIGGSFSISNGSTVTVVAKKTNFTVNNNNVIITEEPIVALTASINLNFYGVVSNTANLTMDAAGTLNIIQPVVNKLYQFIVTNTSVLNTLTPPAGSIISNSVGPNFNLTPNGKDIIECIYDGTFYNFNLKPNYT